MKLYLHPGHRPIVARRSLRQARAVDNVPTLSAACESAAPWRKTSMQVRFIFNDPVLSPRPLSDVVGALKRLQRIWSFTCFISLSEEGLSQDDVERLTYALSTPSVPDDHSYLLNYRGYTVDPYLELDISYVRYGSPLQIDGKPNLRLVAPSRLRAAFQILQNIITLDSFRAQRRWEAELSKQRAIEAMLKNAERMLELSAKIRNKQLREEFIRSMSRNLAALDEPERFRLVSAEIIGDEHQEKKTA